MSSLVNLLDGVRKSSTTSGSTPTPTATPSHSGRQVSSLVRIKPEPVEAGVPQKRLSDIAFGVDTQKANDESSFPHSSSPKRLKAEATPKTPLSLINHNTGSSESIQAQAPPPPFEAIEDIRAKINEIQTGISTYQNFIDRINRKRTATKAEVTRMSNYTHIMDDLRRRKNELNSSIPSISPMKGLHSRSHIMHNVKAEGSLMSLPVPPAFQDPAAPARSQMFQDIKGETIHTYLPVPLAFQNPSMPARSQIFQDVKAETIHTNLPVTSAFHRPAFGSLAVKQQVQPVASGSNVSLHANRGSFDMDTDDDDDDLNNLPAAVLQRIGPIIPHLPVLQGENHHDENGDFHGRGRDLFVGPQAKADEYVTVTPSPDFCLSLIFLTVLTSFFWRPVTRSNLMGMPALIKPWRS
jgi:hypothetical protein